MRGSSPEKRKQAGVRKIAAGEIGISMADVLLTFLMLLLPQLLFYLGTLLTEPSIVYAGAGDEGALRGRQPCRQS